MLVKYLLTFKELASNVCNLFCDKSSLSRPLSWAKAEVGTDSKRLLGNPSAWSGLTKPVNALSLTRRNSPVDITRP